MLDKKELNIYKNNQVLLKEYKNPSNGLWDIPIVSHITPNNYVMPTTHLGMYSSHSNHIRSSPSIKKNITRVMNKLPKKSAHKKDSPIEDLDEILNNNTNSNHKANVIIRKKQSKRELAQYLHTACLSPTISIFSAAIQKNNFSS